MDILNSVFSYLLSSHALVAVVLPLGVCLLAGVLTAPVQSAWYLWVAMTVLSWTFARWEESSDGLGLFIIPFHFFYLAFSLYLGKEWVASHAYAQSFGSLLLVDLFKAYELVPLGRESLETFFWGVGGAGAFDSLFVVPLASALLVFYVRARRHADVGGREKNHVVGLA